MRGWESRASSLAGRSSRPFRSIFGTEPKGRPEEIMILLHRLLKPPPADGATPADNTAPEPMLGVPVAEGSERYRERERLLAYLREEVDALPIRSPELLFRASVRWCALPPPVWLPAPPAPSWHRESKLRSLGAGGAAQK